MAAGRPAFFEGARSLVPAGGGPAPPRDLWRGTLCRARDVSKAFAGPSWAFPQPPQKTDATERVPPGLQKQCGRDGARPSRVMKPMRTRRSTSLQVPESLLFGGARSVVPVGGGRRRPGTFGGARSVVPAARQGACRAKMGHPRAALEDGRDGARPSRVAKAMRTRRSASLQGCKSTGPATERVPPPSYVFEPPGAAIVLVMDCGPLFPKSKVPPGAC